ncbi:MAG TPA: GGDEF domain-containing protein [Terracidiphilus sp.]|nr:GGDEF domain-containing protein [Terracidiphilus sp.]
MSISRLALGLMVLLTASGASAEAAPERLTTLATIKQVDNEEAQRHMTVAFEATVTYFRGYQKVLFVQDGAAAIYVSVTTDLNLVPGDRVLVRGMLRPSFRPYVASSDITLVGHAALPKPVQADFDQMISAQTDCKLVTVRASVRTADLAEDPNSLESMTYMQLLVDGGNVEATVNNNDQNPLPGLIDSQVEITGVASGQFDNKMQQTGVLLHIQSMRDIKVLARPATDPWSLSVTPMDRLILGRRISDSSRRMRVHGTVTFYEPGQSIVLQDGLRSVQARTESSPDVHIGDLADAIGFPDVQDGFLTLTQSELRDDMIKSAVTPVLYRWKSLSIGGNDGLSHVFDLVSIDGQVVTEVRQATQDEYVLQSDGHLFSAILHHPGSASRIPLPPMEWVPVGSRIRVTGICILSDANPFNGEVPFNILMRSIDDVQILARPPWLNVRHLLFLVAVLLVLIVVVGGRGWYVEYKARRRTGALAHIEQRRSRILENMNNSRPLAEILEQIAALVSFKLQGLPCWCQLADGATLGNRPRDLKSPAWRVTEHPIASHSGARLGTIFAAVVGRRFTSAEAGEALASAAGLASLAIETSRLHSDLVHRSEFDQLTNVSNRFSLEHQLDMLIDLAGQPPRMFGLIYIDLDDFKQVNDRYGHLAGDIYLQEAATRMKRQLRPGDTLARLGGDEFAILVPEVPNRAAVTEVAMRLEACFDTAFKLGIPIIAGTASIGIALFPEDATTKDGLLNAADAAMYRSKNARRRTIELHVGPHRSSA